MTIIYSENVPNKYKENILELWEKEKESFPHGLPDNWAKKECIFAIKSKRIIGFILYDKDKENGNVLGLLMIVAEQYRRKGVATEMLKNLRSKNPDRIIEIDAWKKNAATLTLLRKNGYEQTSRIRDLYGEEFGAYLAFEQQPKKRPR